MKKQQPSQDPESGPKHTPPLPKEPSGNKHSGEGSESALLRMKAQERAKARRNASG